MIRVHARFAALALATVAVAAATVAVTGSCDRTPGGSTSDPAPGTQKGPLRDYSFRWTGDESDLPWNRAVFISTTELGRLQPPIPVTFFEDTPQVKIAGRAGEEWYALTEASPSPAMERLLWMMKRRGTFGEKDVIDLPMPKRASVRLTGEEGTTPGDDTMSVVHEESGARLVAVRGGIRGLHFAIWDPSQPAGKDDWRIADHRAPMRPWVFNELKPGATFVIAAKCDGRQWIVRRATLTAGAEIVFDVAAQPEGGGTVVCDDGGAELLIGGDLPIAPLRLVSEYFRARWTNVPPGKHAVRYRSGKVVEIVVEDGGEVVLPK